MNKLRVLILFFALSTSVFLHAQKFAVIGDYGLDGIYEDSVAKLVKSCNPEFIITTGDNNYPNGEDSTIDQNIGKHYAEYIFPYTGTYLPAEPAGYSENRFFPSLGNHDNNTNLAQAYLDYFTLPTAYPGNERYYTFTRGNVQLIALNSDSVTGHEPDGTSSTSGQAFWMLGALSASSAPWKIVYFHHPPFSSGAAHGSHTWMQWPFDSWGVTAVIGGHDHDYERIMDGNFPYFVNGLGGKSIYTFSATPLPESVVRYNGNYGAMLITASPDSITFCFRNIRDSVVDCYTVYLNTGIQEGINEAELNVFPNPFNDFILVTSGKGKLTCEIKITDILGKVIFFRSYVNELIEPINLQKISTGFYLLEFTTAKGTFVKKIVKQ